MESNDPKSPRHVGTIVDPSLVEGINPEFAEPVLEPSTPSAELRGSEGGTNGSANAASSAPPPPPPDRSELLDEEPDDAPPSEPLGPRTQASPPALASVKDEAVTKAEAELPKAAQREGAWDHSDNPESTVSSDSDESTGSASSGSGSSSGTAGLGGNPSASGTVPESSDPAPTLNATDERSSRPSSGFLRTGHPVRDRLLAKAAEAQRQVPPPAESPSGVPQFSSLGIDDSELDDIAAPKSSTAPLVVAGTALSSSQLLLFGTVCGLAALATLFTTLIKLAPREDGAPSAETQAVAIATVAPSAATAEPAATLPSAELAPTVAPPPPRKKLEGPWRIGTAGSGQKLIEGQIGQAPFLKAIQDAGIPKTQAYRVYTALKDEKNLDRCRPRDSFKALVDRASDRALAFEYIVSKEEIYQAREGKDGLLQGKRLDLEVRKQRVQGAMVITSQSFADAARAAHLEPELGSVVNRALDGHTSVSQFQRGDRLRVVAQEVTVLGEFSRYSGIEALEYLPVSGDPIRIYYFTQRKRYYDAKGRAPGEGGWRRPVKNAPITSKFNPQRMHPILKKRMPHNGTDFGAPTGTPIYASLYGTITKLGNYGPNGNFIGIQHAGGYETGYSHLSRFEKGLKVGDKVKTMQPIGYVGSTGRSTGPHLHFSAKKDGAFIDPESLHLDALTALPPGERGAFAKIRTHYDGLLEAVPLPPALPQAAVAPTPSIDPMAPEGINEEPGQPVPTVVVPPEPSPAPETAASATAPIVVPTPAQPSTPNAPAAPPVAAPGNFNSLYLSDKELMESQSLQDDGEVEE